MGYHELPINDETMYMNRKVLKAIATGRIPIEATPDPNLVSQQIRNLGQASVEMIGEFVNSPSQENLRKAQLLVNINNATLAQLA